MPEHNLHTIGVLGGMGPQAAVQFMQRVIDAVPAIDDCDHVPLLVDQNPQVPSRIAALIEGGGEDPSPTLVSMAQRLERAGAKALVMPCNTAHAFAPAIAQTVSIPFLSMVELSVQALASAYPCQRLGMLASPAVRLAKVFDAPLERHGLEPLYADDQDGLLAAIRALKQDAQDPGAIASACAITKAMHDDGADVVLVGCSEFSLIAPHLQGIAPLIDSLDVLVDATVSFSRFGAVQSQPALFTAHEPGAGVDPHLSGSTTREAAQ